MASRKQQDVSEVEAEVDALLTVYRALDGLNLDARMRVIIWIKDYFEMDL